MEELMNWLSRVNFRAIQSDTFLKHTAGTGEWLLKDKDFIRWKEGKFKTFWITGMRMFFFLLKVNGTCLTGYHHSGLWQDGTDVSRDLSLRDVALTVDMQLQGQPRPARRVQE